MPLGHDTLHDAGDAALEVAPVLRSGYELAHVELVDPGTQESLRHLSALYACRQAVHQCRLPHSRLAHVQRVVLVAAAQHLQRALQLVLAPNEGVLVGVGVVHARH